MKKSEREIIQVAIDEVRKQIKIAIAEVDLNHKIKMQMLLTKLIKIRDGT